MIISTVIVGIYSFNLLTDNLSQIPKDEIISNIGYYASEKDLEGIKEEVHRYVIIRTQKREV